MAYNAINIIDHSTTSTPLTSTRRNSIADLYATDWSKTLGAHLRVHFAVSSHTRHFSVPEPQASTRTHTPLPHTPLNALRARATGQRLRGRSLQPLTPLGREYHYLSTLISSTNILDLLSLLSTTVSNTLQR